MTPLALCLVALLHGCVSVADRYDAKARGMGLDTHEVAGAGFSHRVYARTLAGATHVRVYFEGDGTPWIGGRTIAADPTPRQPFALELMRNDAGATLFVGRPCYHGLADAPGCGPSYWTDARYGDAVVASMAAALAAALNCCPDATVTLIGYSGGGVLARLVAARTDRVVRVVTVAANLDVAAWTDLHGYLPLSSSIDPARLPADVPAFAEIHLTGGRDRNVPAALVESYARGRPWVRVERFSDFDHVCCWADAWPALIERLDP